MRRWRWITHHQDSLAASKWALDKGRLCVGWGDTGDLRNLVDLSAKSINRLIREKYPDDPSIHGGRSLRNMLRAQPGDLVVAKAAKDAARQPLFTAVLTGTYAYSEDAPEFSPDYRHQIPFAKVDMDPAEMLREYAGMAEGQSIRLTFLELASTDESSTVKDWIEGTEYETWMSVQERSPAARRACIDVHGARCKACGIDFGIAYGADLGEGYIHVHHVTPMATQSGERAVDPRTDLVPLCPNCHAMVHRGGENRSVDEIRSRLQRGR